jgi:hypothetical protein
MQHFQNAEPVQLRSLQPDVENHQRGAALAKRRNRFVRTAGLPRIVPLVTQDAFHQEADVRFIVDDENFLRHRYGPSFAWLGR